MPEQPRLTSVTLRIVGIAFNALLASAGIGILLLAIDTGPRLWHAWSSWLGPASDIVISGTIDNPNVSIVSTRPQIVDLLAPVFSMAVYFLGLALFLERMGKVLGSRVGTGWYAAAGGCVAAGLATIVWGVRVCARSRYTYTQDFMDLPLAGVWWVVVGGLATVFGVRIVYALLTYPLARGASGPRKNRADLSAAPGPEGM